MSGFRLRLLGSLREPNVRIKLGTEDRTLLVRYMVFWFPPLLAPSLTNGSYACPRSPKFSNFRKSWQKAVFFIESDLLRKNERWHCVIKVKDKISQKKIPWMSFYVLVPFFNCFCLFLFNKKFLYSVQYTLKRLRQCSGSGSVCSWASRIRIRNYFYGSASFHQQAKR